MNIKKLTKVFGTDRLDIYMILLIVLSGILTMILLIFLSGITIILFPFNNSIYLVMIWLPPIILALTNFFIVYLREEKGCDI